MTVTVKKSICYGSTDTFSGSVNTQGISYGRTRQDCSYLFGTPFFTSPLNMINAIDDLSECALIEYETTVFYGQMGDWVFLWDYDTKTLTRRNFVTGGFTPVNLSFIDNSYEMMAYVPITLSSGIVLTDEYSGGTPTGNVKVYDIDWTAPNYTLRNTYNYPYVSGDFFVYKWAPIRGIAKLGLSTRVVIGFWVEPDDLTGVGFLIYTEDTDEFAFVVGPTGEGLEYYQYIAGAGTQYYSSDFADLGDGKAAIILDYGGSEQAPCVVFLDTTAGTAYFWSFPARMGAYPYDDGDYHYEVWDFFAMAPNLSDHSLYMQLEYITEDGTGYSGREYTIRIVKLTSAGEFTLIGEYPNLNEDVAPGFMMVYSKDAITAIQNTEDMELVFIDAFTGNELFRKPFFDSTLISNTADDITQDLIMKADWEEQDLWKQVLVEEYLLENWEESDVIKKPDHTNGWTDIDWDDTEPTFYWKTGYTLGGRDWHGYMFKGATNNFPSESYVKGNQIYGETFDATSWDRDTLAVVEGKRYAATTIGNFFSNVSTNTRSTGVSINHAQRPGWGKYGSSLEVTHLPDACENYWYYQQKWTYYPYARLNGDQPEVYFFANSDELDISHGDAWEYENFWSWLDDNSGEIDIQIYEAFLEDVCEIAMKFPMDCDSVAIEGNSVSVRISYAVQCMTPFIQIRFTDGTYGEAEYDSTNSYGFDLYRYYVTAGDAGKTFSDLVVGAYTRGNPGCAFSFSIFIQDIWYPWAYTPESRTLKAISSTTGEETEIVDLALIDGYPGQWQGDYQYYMRLLGKSIFYLSLHNNSSYPFVVHHGGA